MPARTDIPVDWERSRKLGDRLLFVLPDGTQIDVHYEGNAVYGDINGQQRWRFDNPYQGSIISQLFFERYNGFDVYVANRRKKDSNFMSHIKGPLEMPTGYVMAMLKSSETDSLEDEYNRGISVALDTLTGEQITTHGPIF